ncbi:type I methionyl aminopeptidase [Candidatus Parcubacteria bacterium]|nr:type I methionyl aminopeptidase [Candidatus Parcubacteria bacterium]
MALIKSPEEIEILREAGKILASVVEEVKGACRPGVSTLELDALTARLMRERGGEPALVGYQPEGADRPYPATLCVSVNNEVVHGIPTAQQILKEGDIVGLDTVLKYKGLFIDMAMTVGVGDISEQDQKLMRVTQSALSAAIEVCRAGNTVNDIGCAIEKVVKKSGFGLVEDLGGHGVGHAVHEEPYIQNYCVKGSGTKLRPGMVLALEPIVNAGSMQVVLDKKDGYTYRTRDGKRSAHFEHSVLVTDGDPEILTLV